MKHPEEDYKEIARLGQKLGLPVPQLFLSLEVTKDGEVLETYKDRSRTWNRNFWNYTFNSITNYLSDNVYGTGHLGGKIPTGTAVVIGGYVPNVVGGAGVDTSGILVGTGAGVEDFEGYVLTTKVVHGTGSLKLTYLAQVATTVSYDAPSLTWTGTLARSFYNASGATITISEVALYMQMSAAFMLSRDVVSPTVPVLNLGTLVVTYNMTLALPA